MTEGVELLDGVTERVWLLDAVIEGVVEDVALGVLVGVALALSAVPRMAMLVLVPLPVKELVVQGPPMPPVLVQDCTSCTRLPAQVSGKPPVHCALVLSAMYLVPVSVSTMA